MFLWMTCFCVNFLFFRHCGENKGEESRAFSLNLLPPGYQHHPQCVLSHQFYDTELGLWPISSFPLCKAWWSEMFSLSTSSGKATTKLSLPAQSNAKYVSFCLVVLLFLTMIYNSIVWPCGFYCAGNPALDYYIDFIFKGLCVYGELVIVRLVTLTMSTINFLTADSPSDAMSP